MKDIEITLPIKCSLMKKITNIIKYIIENIFFILVLVILTCMAYIAGFFLWAIYQCFIGSISPTENLIPYFFQTQPAICGIVVTIIVWVCILTSSGIIKIKCIKDD